MLKMSAAYFKDRAGQLLGTPLSAILLLFVITLFTYGMNILDLGFYWDSWGMNWIAQTRGAAGLAQYFSTNRPVWGLLYQLTTPIFGATPLAWNILALGLRWLVAVAVWGLLRLLWPERRELALWAALLSVVYPAFQQHSIGFLYSHFYIVLGAFMASLACSLLVYRQPRRRWLWLALGLVLSAINLMMMEYFFVLELLRPIILWMAFGERHCRNQGQAAPDGHRLGALPGCFRWGHLVADGLLFFPDHQLPAFGSHPAQNAARTNDPIPRHAFF